MQLATSSGVQEAANWSWLVPKDLGPKALFGRSANPTWAELRASAKHSPGFAGYPEDRNLSSCPRHLNVPLEDGPGRPAWPFWGRTGNQGRHDSQTMEWKPRGDCGHRTRGKKRGSANKGPSEAGGRAAASPPPPPTPRPFQSHRLNHIVAPKPSLTSKEIFSRCSKRRRAVGR